MGASGAAGVAATLLSLNENTIAPTINLDISDADCDLDYTPNVARENAVVKAALCNCIGFGSKNSGAGFRENQD
jgi:3-oxoacyl-[acyl-carrier-protein] synthase II